MRKQQLTISAILLFVFGFIITQTVFGQQSGNIHDAVVAGDLDKVRTLIEADSTLLESRDETRFGKSPLHLACSELQVEIANYLIDQGANVNATYLYGSTPLIKAAEHDGNECLDLIQRLINRGADINYVASYGFSALHMATYFGNQKIAGFLIEQGADLNVKGRHGTPMQLNIIYNYYNPDEEMLIFLVENGAKPQKYSFGNNDLHLAAIKGYTNLVQAMVKHGADINAVNDYGHTPLYYASMHGHRSTADVLIAVGADKSSIVETNYDKAAQLTDTLRQGEAYLWYLGGIAPGTGYAVKTKNNLLIFDPFQIDKSPEALLANGNLNPDELAGQNITILLTRKKRRRTDQIINKLAKLFPDANFVFSFKPTADIDNASTVPAYHLAKANESFSVGEMKINTIQTRPSTVRSTGNLGYLVEVDGVKVLHAGIHRTTDKRPAHIEKYCKEIDYLKSCGPIDFAILPAGFRHLGNINYEQYLYLVDKLSPKAIYLIGDDMVYEEHRKCIAALKKRDVPVFYPDGGIALGQRFHYTKFSSGQQFTDLYGDYLGQIPPGDTAVVFAQGIVSTDLLEHSPAVFSPNGNELFWWGYHPPDSLNREWVRWGLTMKRINNRWTVPEECDLFYGDPFFSKGGKRLYFSSEGVQTAKKGISENSWTRYYNSDIMYVEKQGEFWGEPQSISPVINTDNKECTATFTNEGTVYFLSYLDGVEQECGIFRSRLENGEYLPPEALPTCINSTSQDWTPFIAPDESYLIFSSNRKGGFGMGDLYISFHDAEKDTWSEPVNMGKGTNSTSQERLPGVSPDGKYLFFTRWLGKNNHDIYWVSTNIIQKLKDGHGKRYGANKKSKE
jgi:ankyrin repeat protein